MRPFKVFRDEQKHSDVERYELTGPVKQEMQTLYKAHLQSGVLVQGKIEVSYSRGETNYIITYDKDGNTVRKDEYGTDEHNVELYENTLHKQTIKYSLNGELKETTLINHNEQGRLTDYTSRTADGKVKYRSVHTYNDEGKTLENITYKDETDTNISNRTVYTYDEKGNGTLVTQYNGNGEVTHLSTTTYDNNGKKLEHVSEWFEERMIEQSQRDIYRYNEHGDCIEMNLYKLDGTLKNSFTFNYEYDSNGKKINKNKPVERLYDLEEGETETIEKTDRYRNWIQKTRFHNQKPINIYVRDITYFDDAEEKPLVHPLSIVTNMKEQVKNTNNKPYPLEKDEVKWLAETPGITADSFPAVRYYMMRFGEMPSLVSYTGPAIEAINLAEHLQDYMGAQMIHSYGTVWNGYREHLSKYTLAFKYNPYLLLASGINSKDKEEFLIPHFIEDISDRVYISAFQLLRPSEASGERDEYFERELDEFIQRFSIEKKPDKPVINIIETTGNNFTMKEYPVDDNFEIRDLDVNYGYGFQKFHNDLMMRFNTSTKGLVLFHGAPGTGKTYYIRHLLRSMAASKKVVIYMPPNMVDHLVEPLFMTFLTEEVKTWSEEGNFCVLLIEDAEPLLAKRQEGVRIQGITNLLNMSDGLLNDMLNLQIICTFNVGLRKLDSALLRPGRLIARKEFKPLPELDANLLAQRIGVKHHFKGPATLGEIYAMRKNQNILVHETDPDENSSTAIDDLI